MASAKGRFLSSVSGMIENAAPHYMYQKNGKSFVAFRRKGWDKNKQSDAQKIQCVKFANQVKVGNAVWLAYQRGGMPDTTTEEKAIINAVFKYVHPKDDIQDAFYNQPLDETHAIHQPCATIRDLIMKEIAPKLKEEAKQEILEAAGKTYFEPTLEGYMAMKASQTTSVELLIP